MADFTTNAYANVYVDNKQAKNRLNELSAQAETLRKKLDSARLSGDVKGAVAAQKELKKVEKEANNVVKAYFDVDKVMQNLSKSGVNDLKKALAHLHKEMNSGKITRGTKEWDEYTRKIKDVKREIENVDKSMRIIPTRMERMADTFNRYAASLATIGTVFYGIKEKFSDSIAEFAQLDDKYSDVMKTTQMTHEQVAELNKDFQKIDTRTARMELNDLAADAGKLGLSAKQDVLDFVEAGNMINVALGEDLGDGAIKNIGKLVTVYKASTQELQDAGLKENMLAIGSAINAIGQSSTASEPYLIDFSQRLGGIGSQAGLSIQDILGYASALDQAGEKTEMSATAFSKLIMKIMASPADFAKIAGKDVKQFSVMMKTDMNGAIMAVLKGLGDKGGLQQLLPVFKDMGLDAARAAEVVSSLAGNISLITEAQRISNDEFSKGTSILNEYDTKNNNAQAILDKRKKAVFDTSVLLGEKLMPVMSGVYGLSGAILRLLPGIIDAVVKHQKAILLVAAAYTLYFTRAKLAGAATTLHHGYLVAGKAITESYRASVLLLAAAKATLTGNTVRAQGAMLLFNKIVSANKVVAFISVVMALGTAIYMLTTKTSKAEESLKDFNAELIKEETDLKNIFEAYKKANAGTEEKDRLLGVIKEKYGEYIGHLIDEKGQLDDVSEAQRVANERLQESIALKFRDKALSDIQSESVKNQAEALRDIYTKLSGNKKIGKWGAEEAQNQIKAFLSDETKTAQEIKSDIQNYLKEFFKIGAGEYYDTKGFLGLSGSLGSDIANLVAYKKDAQKEIKDIEELYKPFMAGGTIDILVPFRKPDNKPTPPGYTPPAGDDKKKNKRISAQRKKLNDALEELEREHNETVTEIDRKFIDGKIKTEAELDDVLLAQDKSYTRKRIEQINKLLADGALSEVEIKEEAKNKIAELNKKQLDEEVAATKKRRKELDKEDRSDVRLKLKMLDVSQSDEESGLASKRKKDLITEQQYRDLLLHLDMAYAAKRLQVESITEVQREELQQKFLEAQKRLYEDNAGLREKIESRKPKKERPLSKMKEEELSLLNEIYAADLQNSEAYATAKAAIEEKYHLLTLSRIDEEKQRRIDATQFALEQMQTLMSGFSSYMQAANDAEIASVNRKYDEQIKAAGKNERKVKKIEEQRDKELKEIRRKNEDSSFRLQIAQALASTAQSAINAYSSTAAIPIIGPAAAPIAAAVATAAGMLQVAAIKKQHDAAMQEFYTGGYTMSGNRREVAGIVHKGEFVGNAAAVQNPVVRNVFDVIDLAQRNNTVSSLSEKDFSRALDYRQAESNAFASQIVGGLTAASAGQDSQQAATQALLSFLSRNADVTERLNQRLNEPFVTQNTVTGKYGIKQALDNYNKIQKNKNR